MKEIVIKVDELDFDLVKKYFKSTGYSFIPLRIQTEFISAIMNGIPLPKGHGRLIDADNIPVDLFFNGLDISKAETLIEADKEYGVEVITRGNCMICGKELTEGLFFCKECEDKAKKEGDNHGEEKLS